MDTTNDDGRTVAMALGRIFILMSRPTQRGDVERYEAARSAIVALVEPRGFPAIGVHRPGWNFGNLSLD